MKKTKHIIKIESKNGEDIEFIQTETRYSIKLKGKRLDIESSKNELNIVLDIVNFQAWKFTGRMISNYKIDITSDLETIDRDSIDYNQTDIIIEVI